MKVKIKLFDGGKMPVFKHKTDACADAYARLASDSITIKSGERCQIALGFAVELPEGYELQVRGRSGNTKMGIDVGFGTGDSGYIGEYQATVINNQKGDVVIKNGERICQIAIRPIPAIEFEEVETLEETERGANGFGSTGK